MAMKRSGKFYRKNEKEVMEQLGFVPTPNSGSGWIVKEDGQSEDMVCQLKSTDASSIGIKLADIHTLQYNSQTEHKIPVFVIQFLKTNEVFLLVSPDNIQDVAQYLRSGIKPVKPTIFDTLGDIEDVDSSSGRRIIKSSNDARHQVRSEMESKNKKKIRSAK